MSTHRQRLVSVLLAVGGLLIAGCTKAPTPTPDPPSPALPSSSASSSPRQGGLTQPTPRPIPTDSVLKQHPDIADPQPALYTTGRGATSFLIEGRGADGVLLKVSCSPAEDFEVTISFGGDLAQESPFFSGDCDLAASSAATVPVPKSARSVQLNVRLTKDGPFFIAAWWIDA